MTVGAVSLAGVQDKLAELQAAAGGGTGTSGAATGTGAAGAIDASGDSTDFATTLAEATAGGGTGAGSLLGDELAATAAGPSDSVSPSGLLQPLSATSTTGSTDAELLSLLMAMATGGAGSGTGLDGISGTTGSTSGSVGGVTGSDVVAEAAQFEGTPYVWGGTSPSGFDCSGLVQYVYGQLGVPLPRTSEEQSQAGTAVDSLAAAQPGDLVFFAGSDGTAGAPGHVGIYVGNGQMIDAPHTGTSVQVQPVSSAGTVVAIRRVLPTGAGAAPGAATLASEVTSAGAATGAATFGSVAVPSAYASTVEQAAGANGIPASLLAAVLQQESGFNPGAVSSAGAEGIAQFMPSTAAGLGINPLDPTQAIEGCAQLLGSYTRRFGSYADAAAAYNAGPGAVAEYGGVPPYAETQAYVPAVLNLAGLSGSAS